jgi:hypothetical protein
MAGVPGAGARHPITNGEFAVSLAGRNNDAGAGIAHRYGAFEPSEGALDSISNPVASDLGKHLSNKVRSAARLGQETLLPEFERRPLGAG